MAKFFPQELLVVSGTCTIYQSSNDLFVLSFILFYIPGPSPQPPISDLCNWNCSEHQKLWMKKELQDLGLWPGSHVQYDSGKCISLWRLPPHPELIDTNAELQSPNLFQLHPFFIWKPENEIMAKLRDNFILPCFCGCPYPKVYNIIYLYIIFLFNVIFS